MDAELQTQIAFHRAGRKPGADAGNAAGADARPALLARYRDLAALRYDFPLVLLRDAGDKGYVQCLSGIVDNVVHGLVKDDDGERLTRHLLRLEREIRVLLQAGARGSLAALWDDAASRLMRGRRRLAERQPDARAPGAEGGRRTRRLRRVHARRACSSAPGAWSRTARPAS